MSCLFFLLVLCFSSIAYLSNNTYDDFENTAVNSTIWTITGSPVIDTSPVKYGSKSLNTPASTSVENKTKLCEATTSTYVISYWANRNSGAADSMQDSIVGIDINCGYPTNGNWGYYSGGWKNLGFSCEDGEGDVTGNWLNHKFVINETANKGYWYMGTNASPRVEYALSGTGAHILKLNPSPGDDANYDHVQCWDYATYGFNGVAPPSAPTGTPSLNLTNLSHINYNPNLMVSGMTEVTYYEWWVNSVLIQNASTVYFNASLDAGMNNTVIVKTKNDVGYGNQIFYVYVKDIASPTIDNWAGEGETYNKYYQNDINASWTCRDSEGIWSFEYNITNSTNKNMQNISYVNITNNPKNSTIEAYINLTNYPSGAYTVNWRCADYHTLSYIPNYKVIINESKVIYDTKDNSILLESLSDSYTFDNIIKYTDRYSYDVVYSGKEVTTFDIKVQTKEKLWVLPKSPYTMHFISSNNWIDFEGLNVKSYQQVDDYTYLVTVENKEAAKTLTVNSIGELNVGYDSATFYVTYSAPTVPVNMTVNISKIDSGAFKFDECTDNSLERILLIAIAFFGVLIASLYKRKLKFIGLMASIMLIVSGILYFACSVLFAIVVVLFGLLFLLSFLF